jgi:hypothetical protein
VKWPPSLINLSFWVRLVSVEQLTWYQRQRSWVWILAGVIYQNKLKPTHIPRLRHTRAAREGECWIISEISTFPHQLKLLGMTGRCRIANSSYISLKDVFDWLHELATRPIRCRMQMFGCLNTPSGLAQLVHKPPLGLHHGERRIRAYHRGLAALMPACTHA